MIAFSAIFLRSSCSGSAAHFRKVATSLAIWLAVAGVPSEYSMTFEQITSYEDALRSKCAQLTSL